MHSGGDSCSLGVYASTNVSICVAVGRQKSVMEKDSELPAYNEVVDSVPEDAGENDCFTV